MDMADLTTSYSVNGSTHTHKLNDDEDMPTVDSNVEVQMLREELDRINAEFLKANEERAKAAEYGLILLEEKQALQDKNEELATLYDRTKQELDTSALTLRQVQRDYEKRVKQVERQREELISEMDGRERELLLRVENLEEERRGFERTIKKMSSQHDYLTENNAILNSENERLKQELTVQKEELRVLKRKDHETEMDVQKLTEEVNVSRSKLDKLIQYEKALEDLSEQNQSLQHSLSFLQEQCDRIAEEKEDLENQKKDIAQALNEEREVKSFLENKLREDLLRSPHRVSWLSESTAHLALSPTVEPSPVLTGQIPVSASAPTSPTPIPPFQQHSTPLLQSKMAPSLFTEMNESLAADDQSLSKKISELSSKLEETKAENTRLSEQLKDVSAKCDKWRTQYKKIKKEKNAELESLNDELSAKKEITTQLNSQLNVANKEKASLEIEIEGLREEMKRGKETSRMENEKIEKEFLEEHSKCEQLQARVNELEEKLSVSVTNGEKLETVLVNSTGEVSGMIAEMANLHRAIKTLQRENQFVKMEDMVNGETPDNEGSDETYSLTVLEGKRKLRILKDNQTLEEVAQLKESLRQLRLPLEVFTKNMLQSSLAVSSKLMVSGPPPGHQGGPRELPVSREEASSRNQESVSKKINELESNLNKTRARLANRSEEVNQLRAIMKARETTNDVTVSSLKSKLDGQKRAHEAEINQYKHKVKTLRKERDDQISLGALTSRRCQEYLDEISKVKRRIDELRGESDQLRSDNKLLSVFLDRSIQQKLSISQELERYREEEERTRVIPLTLSSSRV